MREHAASKRPHGLHDTDSAAHAPPGGAIGPASCAPRSLYIVNLHRYPNIFPLVPLAAIARTLAASIGLNAPVSLATVLVARVPRRSLVHTHVPDAPTNANARPCPGRHAIRAHRPCARCRSVVVSPSSFSSFSSPLCARIPPLPSLETSRATHRPPSSAVAKISLLGCHASALRVVASSRRRSGLTTSLSAPSANTASRTARATLDAVATGVSESSRDSFVDARRRAHAPRTCAGVAWTSPSARDVREIPPASSRTTNSQSISSSARMRWVEGEATCGDDEVEAREGGTRGTRREGNERTKERRVVTVVHC